MKSFIASLFFEQLTHQHRPLSILKIGQETWENRPLTPSERGRQEYTRSVLAHAETNYLAQE